MADTPTAPTTDEYDRLLSQLHGLPDVQHAGPRNVQHVPFLHGPTETFIVTTYRTEDGDHVFLQYISSAKSFRLVLPPKVTAAIATQRDAIGTKNRRAGAKRAVETKREKGLPVGNPEALAKARKTRRTKKR